MNSKFSFILIAAAALAACDTSPEVIQGGTPDPQANEIANAVANVQLPPSIVASHKYRCKDNSVLSIDWLTDGTTKSARVTKADGSSVSVTEVEAGKYEGEGLTVEDDAKMTNIKVDGQSCKR